MPSLDFRVDVPVDPADVGSFRPAARSAAAQLVRVLGGSLARDRPGRDRPEVELVCWRAYLKALRAEAAGDLETAVDGYGEAVSSCAGSAELHYRQVRGLDALGRRREALAVARDAVTARGQGLWRLRTLERRLAGDLTGALEVVRHRLDRGPGSAAVVLEVGRLLFELDRSREAAAILSQASLGNDPFLNAERQHLLALIEADGGDVEGARRRLEVAQDAARQAGRHRLAASFRVED